MNNLSYHSKKLFMFRQNVCHTFSFLKCVSIKRFQKLLSNVLVKKFPITYYKIEKNSQFKPCLSNLSIFSTKNVSSKIKVEKHCKLGGGGQINIFKGL